MATLRRMIAADLSAVLAIQQASPGSAQWSAAQWQAFLSPEQDTSNKQLRAGSYAWTARTEGVLAGFLAALFSGQEMEILNVAVVPSARRRGTAARLLERALAAARTSGAERAWLEVRASNSGAIAFYERSGFVETGRRQNYYSEPAEDAVLLSRPLSTDQ